MCTSNKDEIGAICWTDLTVENAGEIRAFYEKVVGWVATAESMGDYDDFNMTAPSSGAPVAGVCHARGANADIPPRWLVYIIVEDVDESAKTCADLGGKVLVAPRPMAGGRFCVIEDPAGAVCALYRR